MANIGTFHKAEDGSIAGVICTLQLNTKAKLVPLDAPGNGGPDFRILAGNAEIGAAWKRVSQQERPYISVKLDDPSLKAPIYASLYEDDEAGQFSMIWTRPKAN
jgi:uncharacterized protein (DUF736 family)